MDSNGTREAINELVDREIRRGLMMGTFASGEKVSLAQQIGTRLTPVRGAMNRLIVEGAFHVLPDR